MPYTYTKWTLDAAHLYDETKIDANIKFNCNTDTYVDFNTSFLEVEIEALPALLATETAAKRGIALDGPSTSLIQDLKIFSNG